MLGCFGEGGNWGIPRDLPREWPANLLHLVRIYAVCKLALETLQNNKPHKSVPVFGRRRMIMFARIHFAAEILSPVRMTMMLQASQIGNGIMLLTFHDSIFHLLVCGEDGEFILRLRYNLWGWSGMVLGENSRHDPSPGSINTRMGEPG